MKWKILIAGLLWAGQARPQEFAYRQLLIFGKEANRQLVKEQLQVLDSSAAGVKERAIKTTIVKKEDAVCNKYKINRSQFTVVLIGKDGFEKYRTHNILKADRLFTIIDAMPMRKAEMNKKSL